MNRLREAGILERTEAQDWHGGYDWRTTERGRRIAEAFAEEWGRNLEIGDTSNSDNGDD